MLQKTKPVSLLNLDADIIQTMVDAGLDPKEFHEFIRVYGKFCIYGVAMMKLNTSTNINLGELNCFESFDAGSKLFQTFLEEFESEFTLQILKKNK